MSTVRNHVRFNPRAEAFAALSRAYRSALKKAENLWRKVNRSDVKADPKREEKLRRALVKVDERLDTARVALLEHTVTVARDPMRTHVKNLGLERGRRAAPRVEEGAGAQDNSGPKGVPHNERERHSPKSDDRVDL